MKTLDKIWILAASSQLAIILIGERMAPQLAYLIVLVTGVVSIAANILRIILEELKGRKRK